MIIWLTNPNGSQTPLDYAPPYPLLPGGAVDVADTRDIDELSDVEFEALLDQLAGRYYSRWRTSLAEDLGDG